MLGLNDDIRVQEHATDQGEVSERGKPSGGINEFVSDDEDHNDLAGLPG